MKSDRIHIKNKIGEVSTLKIEPFDTTKRYSKPHKHNKYIEIVYLSEGSGTHTIDSKVYTIQPPVFYFVKRGEVHHWAIDSMPKGFVIIFKDAFIEETSDKQINNLLIQITKLNHLKVDEPFVIEQLFELLCLEQKTTKNKDVTEGLLKALFTKIVVGCKLFKSELPKNKVDELVLLLNNKPQNSVSFYAEQLHISPQHLNSLCQSQLQKSASEVIAIYVNKEAKRLLLYTNLNITEIAHQLQFNDVSHFVKYFKKSNQITPLNYRKIGLQ
ncbi:AraC family transcriptional regulator [Formosa haliotis]|uniref:AraC family transcriptional regulator n=1 Tax=Formosa haliotis TaxID=1555194 RepID=UPI0008258F12|nr:AraC family transcriptional regulator [Formosa haliotis]